MVMGLKLTTYFQNHPTQFIGKNILQKKFINILKLLDTMLKSKLISTATKSFLDHYPPSI